ncbi:MAG: hypothetical protein JF586_21675 [Burkholderiales bacterium]|nr:hypothetical protein [Burkholderiales bacterium]
MIMRVIAILLLSFVGLAGLGMSLCGGVFTFSGLLASGRGGGGGGEFRAQDFLPISVPSLLVGLAVLYGVYRGWRRLARNPVRPPGEPPSA